MSRLAEVIQDAGDGSSRLSEPGQQRTVFPVHLSRRALLRSDHHHGRDGDRGSPSDRRVGAGRTKRARGAYVGEKPSFGAEYLIPKPFDPRLMTCIAPAVAQAA